MHMTTLSEPEGWNHYLGEWT